MPVVNCLRCHKLFNYLSGERICSVCKDKDEEEFKKVRKYIREHEMATISDVSTELEISVKTIKKFIRQGRLEITKDSPLGIDCERCGTQIKSGRYCEECAKELERGFNRNTNKIKNKSSFEQKEGNVKTLMKARSKRFR